MAANPWDKFFWNDWENDPALRLCSLAAQGLWMRMLCVAAKAEPKGYLLVAGRPLSPADLASLVGKSVPEVEALLNELASVGVFSLDRKHRIYNRRMVRAVKLSQEGRKAARKRWDKVPENIQKKSKPNGLAIGPPTTHKPEAISQKEVSLKRETSPPGQLSKAVENWNLAATAYGLPEVSKLTADRERNLRARLKDHGLSGWNAALQNLGEMPFCLGKNDRGWRVTFDWLLKPVNLNKVLERVYVRAEGDAA